MASPGEIEVQNRLAAEFFDRCRVAIPGKVIKALQDAQIDLVAQGVEQAPYDKGPLQGSIEKEPITIAGSILTGNVVARLEYAHPQHENEWYNHPKKGKDHYLTDPLADRNEMYQASIGQAIMEALKEANSGS